MSQKSLNAVIAQVDSGCAPYAVGNFDHACDRVTGFLLDETGKKPSFFYSRAGAENQARAMNALPHAPGRVYVVVASEVQK